MFPPLEALKSFGLGAFRGLTGVELSRHLRPLAQVLAKPEAQMAPLPEPFRATVPEAAQTGALLGTTAMVAPGVVGLARLGSAGLRALAARRATRAAPAVAEVLPAALGGKTPSVAAPAVPEASAARKSVV